MWTIDYLNTVYSRDKDGLVARAETLCRDEKTKPEGYAILAYCMWRENGTHDKNLERYIYKALYLDPNQPIALYVDEQYRQGDNR